MILFPIFFLGIVGFILYFAFKENEKNKNTHTTRSPGAPSGAPKEGGFYNLADEIRKKAGLQPAQAKPPGKPKPKGSYVASPLHAKRTFAPTVAKSVEYKSALVKHTYNKITTSKMKTVTRGNPLYSIKASIPEQEADAPPSLYSLLTDSAPAESNSGVIRAMVIGEALSKPRWKK